MFDFGGLGWTNGLPMCHDSETKPEGHVIMSAMRRTDAVQWSSRHGKDYSGDSGVYF